MTETPTLAAHEEQILWASVLGCKREDLYSAKAPAPTAGQTEAFNALARRRLQGEPIQYLTGTQGFRRLELEVGPGVLVPRPETEMVVERCLQLLEDTEAPNIVDIGTGSGAIALALATERPDSDVWAVDSSPDALKWAERNVARLLPANVHLLSGEFFGPVPRALSGSIGLVVSNPPYLSEADLAETQSDVREHEPRTATVAGRSGMEMYPKLAEESLRWLSPGGWLVVETSEALWGRLRCVLAAFFRDVNITPDLTGRLRVAEGRKP